jgi:hypothetical protein
MTWIEQNPENYRLWPADDNGGPDEEEMDWYAWADYDPAYYEYQTALAEEAYQADIDAQAEAAYQEWVAEQEYTAYTEADYQVDSEYDAPYYEDVVSLSHTLALIEDHIRSMQAAQAVYGEATYFWEGYDQALNYIKDIIDGKEA